MKTSRTISILAVIILIQIIICQNIFSQVSELWTHRYTGPEASADSPEDFVVDNAGNIYLTGNSIVGGGYFTFITVKFNSAGVRQWVSKYDAVPFSNSMGVSIATDNSGNVYVTGNTRVGSGQVDLLIIKYNQFGVKQWSHIYNGPGNFGDYGISIAADSLGNVYTGGYSFGSGTSYDYVLLKYNSAGVNQWVKRYNSPTNQEDYLKKIELASNNEIYVTGSTNNTGSSNNFVTIKYNSSGDTLWTAKYNGPVNGDDKPSDMTIDNLNNIYVCGQTRSAGIGYDFAVVKYNSSGVQQWAQTYNSPHNNDDLGKAVDTDLNGNVFVTGSTYSAAESYDYTTIKYNSSGVLQWTRTYDGENLSDKPSDIQTDASGNSFVTGSSFKVENNSTDCYTIKYDPSGNVIWSKAYDGPGNLDDNPIKLIVDNNGKSMIIANSYSYFFSPLCGSSDYLALRYNASGNVDLETRYDGSGQGSDESKFLFLDNSGNSYVTGFSYDKISDNDYATLKYSSTGEPLWANRYDGGFSKIDIPVAVTVDPIGNVFVTGSSQNNSGINDIVTLKYNNSGAYQWEKRYDGAAAGNDVSVAISSDNSGNSYITGFSNTVSNGKDAVTIKYNSAGVLQWTAGYNGVNNSDDYPNALFTDAAGNTFIVVTASVSGSSTDIVTIKYNSSGIQQWASVYNGSANDSDAAVSISADGSGNIITGGKSKSASSGFDLVTLKYNASGVLQWSQTFSGTAINSNDELISASTDLKGNIYICGNTQMASGGLDYAILKYNTSGNLLWTSFYNGSSNSDDKSSSMCTDLSGNIYVTGFTNDIGTGQNFSTVKFSSDGLFVWDKKYNYIDNDTDKAAMVKVDTTGNVFVTGFSTSIESKRDFFTIKYEQDKNLYLRTLIEGRYDQSISRMIPDTIEVYLRNVNSPYAIVDSSTAVIDSLGNGIFGFKNIQNGINYYIIADNRNTIETWSSAGNSFSAGSLSYDFTTASSKAYGNNLKLKGSKYTVYSGDVNKDGIVDLTDLIYVYNQSSVFTAGFDVADLNGDEIVDLTDLIITNNNSVNFVSVIRP